ncbi:MULTISPECIES: 2-C-methyl-D-erythritol 4-phosphate cytidylyltransferase [Gammaproteobacteria]|uniref:2-C-methyl-D-erythritol 4-phosphate cytidylyltransferase n=1 Tax=Gammaproteobacteria TaxID=1236 RepID=UPI000DD0DE4B|nr:MULTISPECIES: 2-C-methyl-D-erythritol 4-phosphate cytidylyltransferase [Gammaproteobacteria]RTE87119.1 2-C-methyl-D-erythritol 4-phosphate cytidylyltransferase [Aliidiomarina sp. B3213]TCZ93093.1 2-C-methyl-D-erythritol 4-phosphate cytidylyltransferase [Lysobacter sp. N42]
MSVVAVVPAAGVGSRMGADRPKQYLPLFDTTILEHTVNQLLGTECIERVYIAISQNDQYFHELQFDDKTRITRVTGGETRAESVLNALAAVAEKYETNTLVVVHDAARPGITPQLILKAVQVAEQDPQNGTVVCVKATDTMKSVSNGLVNKTLNREHIYHALTPQIFELKSLQAHLCNALESGVAVTDESSAMEWAGLTPAVVEGNASLRKITCREDLIMVRALLEQASEDKG